jgi:nucleotide-binding universal stress UspA family protein
MVDPLSPDMPHKVLVPLDGSAWAEQALGAAARLAQRTGGELRLVTAVEPALAAVRVHEFLQVSDYLQSVARAARDTGIPIGVTVLDGQPAMTLAQYVATHGIDLVVMTTHGRSGLTRLGPGSVAAELVRRAPAPVLLVPVGTFTQPVEFRRIVVAMDGEVGDDLLEPVMDLGYLSTEAQYMLVRVVEPSGACWSQQPSNGMCLREPRVGQGEREAALHLSASADRWREQGLQVITRVLVGQRPGEQILQFAALLKPDLVIVGGRSGCGKAWSPLGSVAEKVIYGARQPVLVAPVQNCCADRIPEDESADGLAIVGAERR